VKRADQGVKPAAQAVDTAEQVLHGRSNRFHALSRRPQFLYPDCAGGADATKATQEGYALRELQIGDIVEHADARFGPRGRVIDVVRGEETTTVTVQWYGLDPTMETAETVVRARGLY
jgi:hypothetical protein